MRRCTLAAPSLPRSLWQARRRQHLACAARWRPARRRRRTTQGPAGQAGHCEVALAAGQESSHPAAALLALLPAQLLPAGCRCQATCHGGTAAIQLLLHDPLLLVLLLHDRRPGVVALIVGQAGHKADAKLVAPRVLPSPATRECLLLGLGLAVECGRPVCMCSACAPAWQRRQARQVRARLLPRLRVRATHKALLIPFGGQRREGGRCLCLLLQRTLVHRLLLLLLHEQLLLPGVRLGLLLLLARGGRSSRSAALCRAAQAGLHDLHAPPIHLQAQQQGRWQAGRVDGAKNRPLIRGLAQHPSTPTATPNEQQLTMSFMAAYGSYRGPHWVACPAACPYAAAPPWAASCTG